VIRRNGRINWDKWKNGANIKTKTWFYKFIDNFIMDSTKNIIKFQFSKNIFSIICGKIKSTPFTLVALFSLYCELIETGLPLAPIYSA